MKGELNCKENFLPSHFELISNYQRESVLCLFRLAIIEKERNFLWWIMSALHCAIKKTIVGFSGKEKCMKFIWFEANARFSEVKNKKKIAFNERRSFLFRSPVNESLQSVLAIKLNFRLIYRLMIEKGCCLWLVFVFYRWLVSKLAVIDDKELLLDQRRKVLQQVLIVSVDDFLKALSSEGCFSWTIKTFSKSFQKVREYQYYHLGYNYEMRRDLFSRRFKYLALPSTN